MTPEPLTWRPGRRDLRLMQLWGTGVFVLGIVVFGGVYLLGHFFRFYLELGPMLVGIAVMVVVGILVVLLHEAVHGLAMLPFGAKPEFGFGLMAGLAPYLYCTSKGHRFTRPQFLTIALAPTLVVNLLLLIGVSATPFGGWLVIPAAVHLSGCVGDWVMAWVAWSQPRGTLVEDLQDGMVFHRAA